jgi:hypothetical protein
MFIKGLFGAFLTGFFFIFGIIAAIASVFIVGTWLLLRDKAIQTGIIKLVIIAVVLSVIISGIRAPFRR